MIKRFELGAYTSGARSLSEKHFFALRKEIEKVIVTKSIHKGRQKERIRSVKTSTQWSKGYKKTEPKVLLCDDKKNILATFVVEQTDKEFSPVNYIVTIQISGRYLHWAKCVLEAFEKVGIEKISYLEFCPGGFNDGITTIMSRHNMPVSFLKSLLTIANSTADSLQQVTDVAQQELKMLSNKNYIYPSLGLSLVEDLLKKIVDDTI